MDRAWISVAFANPSPATAFWVYSDRGNSLNFTVEKYSPLPRYTDTMVNLGLNKSKPEELIHRKEDSRLGIEAFMSMR